MPDSIAADYASRLADRRRRLADRERQSATLSRVRLAIVGLTVLAFIWWRWALAWWYVVPVVVFIAVATVHARRIADRNRAVVAEAFYQRGIARLSGEWPGTGDPGDAFREEGHPYADDLDIFGRGSLYELLATTRTHGGRRTLAGWLLHPAGAEEALARQAAVRELAPRTDLREALAVLGDGEDASTHADQLRAWATAPRHLPGGPIRVVLALLAVVVVAIPLWWWIAGATTTVTARILLAALLGEGLIALVYWRGVHAAIHHADTSARDLDLVSGLLRTIEAEAFTSERLVSLRQALGGTTRPASAEIRRLGQLIALLESRHNLMFAFIAGLLAWGSQLAFAIEAWRAQAGEHVPRWLEALAEFEALAALATYAAEHPSNSYPEFVDGPARIEADALAHPLLPDSAVPNDVRMGGDHPHLLVVSGSNMSGKSTLLRALGVGVVLARAGAPVRAAQMRLSPLAVGASIRVTDSLMDGRSRFYAEITRLKTIVDLTRAHDGAVLFLLDEVLAGTNSHDRRQGADGVLSGLVDLGAIGLATTHDLALGEIAERLAPAAANVHFEDVFAGGVLSFDYQLRPGVVRSSNAIALMRSVGLDV